VKLLKDGCILLNDDKLLNLHIRTRRFILDTDDPSVKTDWKTLVFV